MIITRENYREYDAINYSKLSSLDKSPKDVHEGKFNEGIRTGSMLDMLCFDGEEEFFNKIYVSSLKDSDLPSDAVKKIIDNCGDFSDESLLDTANLLNYGQSWKPETRLNKILESGEAYIRELENSADKEIISLEFYTYLNKAVEKIKTDPSTRSFFEDSDFQKPLVAELMIEGSKHKFKCLCDIYEESHKIIIADLKFTSRPLSSFEYDFIKWRYDLQAGLYTSIAGEIAKKPVEFYNIAYSQADDTVFKFKSSPKTLYCGKYGGTINGRKYKGYQQLAKEFIWHTEHDSWELPYEFCVNSELDIDPYDS